MNFAGVFKVPCVLLCRNNGWAISVPVERQTATETFAEKAAAYGVRGVRVDGNDLFAVVSETRKARERGERGEGPTLIEAITYRMGGHSTNDDPKAYRPDGELEPWTGRDPLERVRDYLVRKKLWSDEQQAALAEEIDARFRDAVSIAERTPAPPLESMFEDIYESAPWHLVEQRQQLLSGPRAPSGH
jgi:2-oxoisovalerate dehydrogenase E1 component alpha subunit